MPRNRELRVRRVYDDQGVGSSYRVLVDRLWPRGVSKSEAGCDEWLKDVAPSPELRGWYDHDVDKFTEFAHRYRAELREPPASAAFAHLLEVARARPVTLVTATRDVEHSGAKVLHDDLSRRSRRRRRRRSP